MFFLAKHNGILQQVQPLIILFFFNNTRLNNFMVRREKHTFKWKCNKIIISLSQG
jgi:hypothetical protein